MEVSLFYTLPRGMGSRAGQLLIDPLLEMLEAKAGA